MSGTGSPVESGPGSGSTGYNIKPGHAQRVEPEGHARFSRLEQLNVRRDASYLTEITTNTKILEVLGLSHVFLKYPKIKQLPGEDLYNIYFLVFYNNKSIISNYSNTYYK